MRTREEFLKLGRVAIMLMMAAAEALAEEHQAGAGRRRIVVSIPDRKLALVQDGRVVKVYDTAVGRPVSPTPAGSFQIVARIPNPTWYGPGKVVQAGKGNPLGSRWLGLSRKGYGIHGTNRPRSIGHPASHGCVRMRNADVEELFEQVAVGDTVELHDQSSPELAAIFSDVSSKQTDDRPVSALH
jgi:lipoprotein-anchoring transpeptidase ErfK/SrfK